MGTMPEKCRAENGSRVWVGAVGNMDPPSLCSLLKWERLWKTQVPIVSAVRRPKWTFL